MSRKRAPRKGGSEFDVRGSVAGLRQWLVRNAAAIEGREMGSVIGHHDTWQGGCRICSVQATLALLAGEESTGLVATVAGAEDAARRLLDFSDAIRKAVTSFRDGQSVSYAMSMQMTLPLGEVRDPELPRMVQRVEVMADVLLLLLGDDIRDRAVRWMEDVLGPLAPSGVKNKPRQSVLIHLTEILHRGGFSHREIAELLIDGGDRKYADERVRDRLRKNRDGRE